MTVQSTDIKFYLTGAVSDGGSQSDPNASLGGYRSSTQIISNLLNNLFDDKSSDEATSGDTDYRCICVKNSSLETMYNVISWMAAEYDPDNTHQFYFAIEVPETAALEDGSAQTIVNEATSPSVNTTNHNGVGSGISNWSSAVLKADGISPEKGGHSYKIASANVEGGSDEQISIDDEANGVFTLIFPAGSTTDFDKDTFLEIERIDANGYKKTIFQAKLPLNDEQITWTDNA